MTSDPDEDDEELSHLVLKEQTLEDQKQEYSRFDKKNQEFFNKSYPHTVCRLCLYQNNKKRTTTIINTRNKETHYRSLKKLLQTFRLQHLPSTSKLSN
jgi:hypothetical protein